MTATNRNNINNDKMRNRHSVRGSSNCLSGIDNDRLEHVEPIRSEATAAWANIDKSMDVSMVSLPSEDNVESSKRWVDNGSKL